MNRAEVFFSSLCTLLVKHGKVDPYQAAEVLEAASALPEEALGTENPVRAASQFLFWKVPSHTFAQYRKKPPWLEAWEEAERDRVVVRLNPETEGTEWWMHAEGLLWRMAADADALPFPEVLASLVAGRAAEVVTTQEGARLFREWVRSIPGSDQEPFTFEGLGT